MTFGPAGGRVWNSRGNHGCRVIIRRVSLATASRSARQSGPGAGTGTSPATPSAPAPPGRPGHPPSSCRRRRPKDPDRYAEFVRRLVERCAGRVTYWQCENEPSNTDLLWAGTAEEYVAHLRTMYDAVNGAGTVVLGGCGHGLLAPRELTHRNPAGDTSDGEDDEPVPDELPWSAAAAHAVDAFGTSVPVWTKSGKIHINRTVTPVFVTV